jgi:hypothetical protein
MQGDKSPKCIAVFLVFHRQMHLGVIEEMLFDCYKGLCPRESFYLSQVF